MSPTTLSSGLRSTERWAPETLLSPQFPRLQSPPWGFPPGLQSLRAELLRLKPTSKLPLLCSPITVILGAHNLRRDERTQQRRSVLRAIPHPEYNPQSTVNDIMLLQVWPARPSGSPAEPVHWLAQCRAAWPSWEARRSRVGTEHGVSALHTVPECLPSSCQLENRIIQNEAVSPVPLPPAQDRLRPGTVCTVAGWGMLSLNRITSRLHEVQLTVQRDRRCRNRFNFYNSQIQICVGNPRSRKSAFVVRPWASVNTT